MNQLINISEAASLGFHGMALLASEAPARLNVKVAAEKLHVSEAHLAKVFQTLHKAGLVSSQRGPKGGFLLNKNPEEISFLDVYEVVESPVALKECPLGYSACGFHACIFDKTMNKIGQEVVKALQNIKLSQFSENGTVSREDK